jgi:hypothetical protein
MRKLKKNAVDPIVLTRITAALTAAAAEAGRPDASEAAKALWADCFSILGWWKGQPPPEDFVEQLTERLSHHRPLARGILLKLRVQPESFACKLVARVVSPELFIAEAQPEGTPGTPNSKIV